MIEDISLEESFPSIERTTPEAQKVLQERIVELDANVKKIEDQLDPLNNSNDSTQVKKRLINDAFSKVIACLTHGIAHDAYSYYRNQLDANGFFPREFVRRAKKLNDLLQNAPDSTLRLVNHEHISNLRIYLENAAWELRSISDKEPLIGGDILYHQAKSEFMAQIIVSRSLRSKSIQREITGRANFNTQRFLQGIEEHAEDFQIYFHSTNSSGARPISDSRAGNAYSDILTQSNRSNRRMYDSTILVFPKDYLLSRYDFFVNDGIGIVNREYCTENKIGLDLNIEENFGVFFIDKDNWDNLKSKIIAFASENSQSPQDVLAWLKERSIFFDSQEAGFNIFDKSNLETLQILAWEKMKMVYSPRGFPPKKREVYLSPTTKTVDGFRGANMHLYTYI